MSARSSLAAAFMFSYNSLSLQQLPGGALALLQVAVERVDPRGQRVEPVVQLLFGQQLAGRVFVPRSAGR